MKTVKNFVDFFLISLELVCSRCGYNLVVSLNLLISRSSTLKTTKPNASSPSRKSIQPKHTCPIFFPSSKIEYKSTFSRPRMKWRCCLANSKTKSNKSCGWKSLFNKQKREQHQRYSYSCVYMWWVLQAHRTIRNGGGVTAIGLVPISSSTKPPLSV